MIKVGVIGLGEVSQCMHLPILQEMCDKYEVTAISDVAPSLVSYIQHKYHIEETYLDACELIDKADINAVLILSPDQYHGEYAARALKAKEILTGKPMKTEYLRFRDIILEAPFFISQTKPVFYPTDVPAQVIREGGARRRAHLDRAIGANATDEMRTTYQMMTGLGCHSFAAVRELFGVPQKIHSVTTASNGEHVVIVMEFADGFLGTYELVNNQNIVQFDAAIEVFQKTRKVLIKYETPYLRYQPAYVEVTESTNTDTKTTTYGPDFHDAFHTELKLFAECIETGRQPKTNLEDAVADLKLFQEIIRVMAEQKK